MKIDNINLPDKPLALAPMEDVTDITFRVMSKRLGADVVYTEFTSSEGLIRNAKKSLQKIQVVEEERPVAIQIFGGIEASMEGAAHVAEEQGPDFIDINCGCWVKDVVKRNQGAGLLKDLVHFEAIVKSTVRGTKLPVTVKTRLGWDQDSIVILDVARMVEQAGAKALTIHCRTRDQGHDGFADWSWLEKIKKIVSIPIIGNGDVLTPPDVARMFETGCDGVMIGRGALMNPFLFRETKFYLHNGVLPPPTTAEKKFKTCLEHLKLSVQYKGPFYGVTEFRKHYTGYLRGIPNVAKLRSELVRMMDVEAIRDRLMLFLEESSAVNIV